MKLCTNHQKVKRHWHCVPNQFMHLPFIWIDLAFPWIHESVSSKAEPDQRHILMIMGFAWTTRKRTLIRPCGLLISPPPSLPDPVKLYETPLRTVVLKGVSRDLEMDLERDERFLDTVVCWELGSDAGEDSKMTDIRVEKANTKRKKNKEKKAKSKDFDGKSKRRQKKSVLPISELSVFWWIDFSVGLEMRSFF